MSEQSKPDIDASHDRVVAAAEAHRKAGARRTAWIIGALAFAFFLASLVEGHLSHIPH
ncbi:MAG: hypothetical protein ACTHJP_10140 [Rhodanobacteraceae bacterium]